MTFVPDRLLKECRQESRFTGNRAFEEETMPQKKAQRVPRGLRVIGGSLKGRRLRTPSGREVRPTLERIRESLFSILGDQVEGAVVLDLFAGSGALGIEALSRGARWALFCDERLDCVQTVQENLDRCGLTGRAAVLHLRVPEGLPRMEGIGPAPFDLVFLDPPYGAVSKERLLEEFLRFAFLKERARIVFEHSQKDVFDHVPAGFVLEGGRRYGDTHLTFLNYQPWSDRDDGR